MSKIFAADAFAGKTALVTGAGSGIGRETALLLGSLGAFVWATDIDEAAVRATGESLAADRCAVRRHDVASERDWIVLADELRMTSGRLDVLVNNAGIMLVTPFLNTSLADWRRQQAINVESVYLGMRCALPLMCATAAAHDVSPAIVNVSSIFGIVAGSMYAAYSASKGAVRALTKAVAIEFAAQRIRVNSLHPGPTRTNLGKDANPRDADGNPLDRSAIEAELIARIPLRRFGEPADMAAAIAYLASDASLYVTGTEHVVDGGFLMM